MREKCRIFFSAVAAGIGIAIYTALKHPSLVLIFRSVRLRYSCVKEIAAFSSLTCMQQSIMNLGILAVQGRVNSFGPVIMAAFAAGVKIDAFAYLPVQDFGNAFSFFISQNHGAGEKERIRKAIRSAIAISAAFGIVLSAVVFAFAQGLMGLFMEKSAETAAVITEGVRYLRIEGSFYALIGILFLLYGLYRGLGNPFMSIVLTVVSLGLRVVLAYALSAIPAIGVVGIWWSVPIGWALADAFGIIWYLVRKRKGLAS